MNTISMIFNKLKELFENRKKRKYRVLNIGCSTGQESYSFAFLFEKLGIDYTFFAVDIDERALFTANRGSIGMTQSLIFY